MYSASRQIEIDAAHRVPRHGSKCRQVHGHRYVIDAVVEAEEVYESGEQQGMAMDFGFMKDIMTEVIHDTCDHRLLLYQEDPLCELLREVCDKMPAGMLEEVGLAGIVELPVVPTAENLAQYWFSQVYTRMTQDIRAQNCRLAQVVVHETPNCSASYTED